MGIPRATPVLATRTIVISLLVGTGVTLLAALVPALRATRVPPVAALAGAPPPASPRARRWAPWIAGLVCLLGLGGLLLALFGSGPATARMGAMAGGAVLIFIGIALSARWFVRPVAAAIGFPLERLFGLPGRLARENAMRNPARTAATSAALMVGLGLVVFVAVFAAGLKASVSGSIDGLLRAGYVVSPAGAEPLPEGAGPAIDRTPGVQTEAPVLFDRVQVDGAAVKGTTDTVEAIDADRLAAVYRFRWIHGSDRLASSLGPDQAIVEEQFAKAHGIALGDRFSVRTPSGGSARLRAVGEYRDPQLLQGMMVAMDVFRRISPATDPYLFLIAASGGAHRALEASLRSFPAAEVRSRAEYRADVEGQVDQVANLLYALLAMSVLISVFGIANSLYLSVHERTREFGLLRAVGTTGPQVRRIVRYESVITSVIGGVLGTGLGLGLAWLMVQALKDLGFRYAVPAGQLVLFLAVSVLVGLAAAAWPARRGARTDVLTALHCE